MRRMTAKDFPQELLDLYDYYAHGKITKREFLDRAGKFAVGGVTAAVLLNQLSPNYAFAQQVPPEDPAIETQRITYPSPNGHGEVNGYLVRPAGATGKLPAVLVIHENRGLNPYIEDVARRMGKAGFMALAPDGLTSVGGYPGNDDEGRELQRTVDSTKLMNDFFAGFEYLLNHDDSTGKVGAVGFCYGGGVVNAIAVAYPELSAGVPFYGRQPDPADVSRIEAPLMIQYAELDERINEGWPAFEEALKANDKEYVMHMYPGVNHGFHNDTTPRYDAEAAKLAEQRTIAFFNEHLT
ncbi:YghX family hydrolase [Roseibium salinum]|uniref:Dienelactone hydrolase family protein n=1 Tax=Roseibium salinum TaxID=1604349 RepID=A0ABT3R3D0_9HYPH|nr:YghX family hydrolase [Roseibium sp. DSM 29163]MCX2723718.1 dienelactone hydrolase family protein [Roseibium sp. DSM 29163]MDN3718429.1 YghX family hydrolase [Roseibium salinum]